MQKNNATDVSWIDIPVNKFNEFCLYLNKIGVGYEGCGTKNYGTVADPKPYVGLVTNKLSDYQESCIKVCFPQVVIRG